jgi:GNAT superfamily N-acetyltransferase
MTTMQVIRAAPGDVDTVTELIATAFHDLDVAGWLVSDPDQRAGVLRANFRIYVEHALSHGVIERHAGGAAAAVWFHREDAPVPPPEDYDRRLATACGPWTARFETLDVLFDAHHPHAPHQHLAFLAVQPDLQGRGARSVLLRHRHEQLDGAGVASYLEASSQRSRALYLRHGYRDLGAPFFLPDGGPPFWPMWREPGDTL